MNKKLYLKYITTFYQDTDKSYTTEYFEKIIYIVNKIPMNAFLTKIALIHSPFTQEYDLSKFGLYYIDFKIEKINKKILNNEISSTQYKSTNFNLKTIYHQFPDLYKKDYNYNSKILITDFFGPEQNYIMIDGNHTYERKKATGKPFLIYCIPYQELNTDCFCNKISYLLYYLHNEFWLIFQLNKDNKEMQKKLISQSKILLETETFI